MKKVGIMTGGGDAPGLNGIIEAATKNLSSFGIEVIGIEDGFEGVYENRTQPLDPPLVDGSHQDAGTLLGTSNKRGIDSPREFIGAFSKLRLDGLIVAGGDGTFKALSEVQDKINIIGIPKTIDNDVAGTDMTFGHLSACDFISRSIDSLKNSANAHKRIMVLETMGRTAGWLALNGGLAGYADAILLPEFELDIKKLVHSLQAKLSAGKRGLVVCASEGVKIEGEEFIKQTVDGAPESKRLGGVSFQIAKILEDELGVESRNVIPGHLQRSEPPSVFDKLMTLKLGSLAAELARRGEWGTGIAYKNGGLAPGPLKTFTGPPRLVPKDHENIGFGRNLDIYI